MGKIRIFGPFSGKIRNSREEIRGLWLRNGEIRGFRAKIVAKLGEISDISHKPSKIVIFPWENKPTVLMH